MDPQVRKELLARVDAQQQRTPAFLYLIGAGFVVLSVAGVILGPERFGRWLLPLTQLAVGMLFLYVGALIHERQRLTRQVRDLLEAFEGFNQSWYGKDYKVQRQAVDILIRSLEAESAEVREKVHAQLVRITGQNLPAEAAAWEKWWQGQRATFARRGAEAP